MIDRDIHETFSMPAQGASWLATSQGFGVELSFLSRHKIISLRWT